MMQIMYSFAYKLLYNKERKPYKIYSYSYKPLRKESSKN